MKICIFMLTMPDPSELSRIQTPEDLQRIQSEMAMKANIVAEEIRSNATQQNLSRELYTVVSQVKGVPLPAVTVVCSDRVVAMLDQMQMYGVASVKKIDVPPHLEAVIVQAMNGGFGGFGGGFGGGNGPQGPNPW